MDKKERIDEEARLWLLEQARCSLSALLGGVGSSDRRVDAPASIPEAAQQNRGCFVSLHTKSGSLRGCIGTFSEQEPLWLQVRRMAIAAGTQDPRFAPLKLPEELHDCEIEISALTPRRPAEPGEIQPGIHGIWVSRGHRSGVLLPQVASDHGWDRHDFLSQTCIKAGLSADAWHDGSVGIEIFEAEVFSEASR